MVKEGVDGCLLMMLLFITSSLSWLTPVGVAVQYGFEYSNTDCRKEDVLKLSIDGVMYK